MKTYVKPELSILTIASEQVISAFDRLQNFESVGAGFTNSITSYFGNSGVTV